MALVSEIIEDMAEFVIWGGVGLGVVEVANLVLLVEKLEFYYLLLQSHAIRGPCPIPC